jgi:hypothetical protein
MRASWKILGFAGGVALAGIVGVACTVTTNSGDDGGTIFDDDASDNSDSTTADTGTTPDTGTSIPAACADVTFPDGGTADFTTVGNAACLACTQASCCTQLGACYQDPTGDCQSLEIDCLAPCIEADPTDAGGCASDCAGLHPSSVSLHEAWSDCQSTNCSTQCQ